MMVKMQDFLNRSVAMLLAAATLFVSCSIPSAGPGSVDPRELVSTAGRLIDENLDLVREAISAEIPEGEDITELTGYDIATRALVEDNGEEYLAFCIGTNNFESVDDVLEAASSLAPQAELEKIRSDMESYEARLLREVGSRYRALSPAQEEEFFASLKSLVIKTAVLLTAAVVYAFVPEMVFWGKISAAAAVAVAAGILSTTFISIVEHYKLDREVDESFQSWLEDVTTEPAASWAIAAAMINLGTSLNRSPVLTALILGVFAVFNIVDEVQTMLNLNFDA